MHGIDVIELDVESITLESPPLPRLRGKGYMSYEQSMGKRTPIIEPEIIPNYDGDILAFEFAYNKLND